VVSEAEVRALIERARALKWLVHDEMRGLLEDPTMGQLCDTIESLTAENARLRNNISHCQGRFLNINICLSSGGTKHEAIRMADMGEDCCKGYLTFGGFHP
jgi:hypothetical protein